MHCCLLATGLWYQRVGKQDCELSQITFTFFLFQLR